MSCISDRKFILDVICDICEVSKYQKSLSSISILEYVILFQLINDFFIDSSGSAPPMEPHHTTPSKPGNAGELLLNRRIFRQYWASHILNK